MKLTGFYALVWFIAALSYFVYLVGGVVNTLCYFGALIVGFFILYAVQQIIRCAFTKNR